MDQLENSAGEPLVAANMQDFNVTFPLLVASFGQLLSNMSANFSLDTRSQLPQATMFPMAFRVIGTFLHSLIFVVGFLGNVMICIVVRKTRSLHTPTYCYLVSLAVADILLVCSAIPQDILSYHLYSKQWVLGHVGCSIMVFTTFLAINAGSISILAFTVERYIAICHPMLAQKVCTVTRARKIITIIWVIVLAYSAPWLGLAVTKPLRRADLAEMEYCDFRLSRSHYLTFFAADVVIFYLIPLIVSVALYTRMGLVLYRSISQLHAVKSGTKSFATNSVVKRDCNTLECSESMDLLNSNSNDPQRNREQMQTVMTSRVQVVKMLVIVVTCFAVLWLPYRGLLVYNSIVSKPWQDMWYMLFAKTLVYCNSAINPFLYTVLSRKFRSAFFRIICCTPRSKQNIRFSFNEASLRLAPTSHPPNSHAAKRPGFLRQR